MFSASKRIIELRKTSLGVGRILGNDVHYSRFSNSITMVCSRSFLQASSPSLAPSSAQAFGTLLQVSTLRTDKSDDVEKMAMSRFSAEQLLEWQKAVTEGKKADAKKAAADAKKAAAEAKIAELKGKKADADKADADADARKAVAEAKIADAAARTAEANARQPVVASAYAPPPLPESLTFASCDFNTSLVVANLPKHGDPFFLDQSQLFELQTFVETAPEPSSPQILIFAGTVKSGKSTLLNTVLPGIIHASHKSSDPYPVIFHHTVSLQSTAEQALNAISQDAQQFAADIGIHLSWKDSMGAMLGQLAKAVSNKKGVLWVLIDEAQEPMVWSHLPESSAKFAREIKRVVELCAPHGGRVALTGSSVLHLCLDLAAIPKNGFSLWRSACVISRGSEENNFKPMADSILESMRNRFPKLQDLEVNKLVERFRVDKDRTRSWFSQRPALLAYFLLEMGRQTTSDTGKAFKAALDIVSDKIRKESTLSTVTALRNLDLTDRRLLHKLAAGKYSQDSWEHIWDSSPTLLSAVKPLLEKFSSPTEPIWFQPPYGALLHSVIDEDSGNLVAETEKGLVRMLPVIRQNLDVIVGLQHVISHETKKAVSGLVAAYLVSQGMNSGVDPKTPDEVMKTKEFGALLGALTNAGKRANEIAGSVEKAEKLSQDSTKFMEAWGYHYLWLCRNNLSHVLIESEKIHVVLRLSVVSRATMIAAYELLQPVHGLEDLRMEDGKMFLHKAGAAVPQVATL